MVDAFQARAFAVSLDIALSHTSCGITSLFSYHSANEMAIMGGSEADLATLDKQIDEEAQKAVYANVKGMTERTIEARAAMKGTTYPLAMNGSLRRGPPCDQPNGTPYHTPSSLSWATSGTVDTGRFSSTIISSPTGRSKAHSIASVSDCSIVVVRLGRNKGHAYKPYNTAHFTWEFDGRGVPVGP